MMMYNSIPERTTPHGLRNLTQKVVSSLSGQIKSGTYRPGVKLPAESRLMTQEGVSRTVIREAMSYLQAMGLIETRHGVGSFVIASSVDSSIKLNRQDMLTMLDVMAVLELRIGLETEAAGLAATRRTDAQLHQIQKAMQACVVLSTDDAEQSIGADREFHLAIAQATGNSYFHNVLAQLGQVFIPRERIDSAALAHHDPSSYLQYVHGEHESIYGAIVRQDSDTARAAMRLHLTNSRERLRQAQELA